MTSTLSRRGSALLMTLLLASCGARPTPIERSAPPRSFAPYAGQAVELFDDRVDPAAVGLADTAVSPRGNPIFRERVYRAELVARMRVSTVTVDLVGGQPRYRISLIVLDSLAQRGFSDDHVELSIGADSPSFGTVRWLDTRLIGRTFVAFVHRFAGAEEPEVRFHLSADSADMLAAVREASTLGELDHR